MRFAGYTKRGLQQAVALANAAVEPETDIYQMAVDLLTDESRPDHRAPISVSHDDVERLRNLTEQMRAVFEAETQEDALHLINSVLVQCDARPCAVRHDDEGWHMHFAPPGAPASELIAATAGMSLALLICDYGLSRIGVCDADGCNQAYADHSRNNRKRYCSVQCNTRSSVAAHRRRAKDTV